MQVNLCKMHLGTVGQERVEEGCERGERKKEKKEGRRVEWKVLHFRMFSQPTLNHFFFITKKLVTIIIIIIII